ncbi:MAG: PriCT-2 domain-containing protein [Magnetococcus sp. YQC-5]
MPSPNLAIVQEFLDRLASGGSVSFRTFDDDKTHKKPTLTKFFHGTLQEHGEELVKLNNAGASVNVMVNAGNGKGTTSGDVLEIRSFFVDLDGAPLEPVQQSPLTPHIVVETSSGKFHVYWLVKDAPLDEFKPVQKALAKMFNGDSNVTNRNRVMRVPGFVHQKKDGGHPLSPPFLSRIISIEDGMPPYGRDQFLGAFQIDPTPPPVKKRVGSGKAITEYDIELIQSALAFISADEHKLWIDIGMALHSTGWEAAFQIWDEWSQGSHNYKQGVTKDRWNSFHNIKGITLGTLFHEAKQRGWKRPTKVKDGVPPAFRVDMELAGDVASPLLRQTIAGVLNQVEVLLSSREEYERWKVRGADDEDYSCKPAHMSFDDYYEAKVCDHYDISGLKQGVRLQVRATAGLGKTRAVVEALIKRKYWHKRHVHMYVPTIALADELAGLFSESSMNVQVIRGRGQPDPYPYASLFKFHQIDHTHAEAPTKDAQDAAEGVFDSHPATPLCAKHKAAEKAAQMGLSVYGTMCRAGDARCQYYDDCGYLAQWYDKSPGIRIFPHDYLFLQKSFEMHEPDLVIVDENVVLKAVGKANFGIDRIDGPAKLAILDHMENGVDLREAMLKHGITREYAQAQAKKLEGKQTNSILPSMTAVQAIQTMETMGVSCRNQLHEFWKRVAAEIDKNRLFHGVWVRQHESTGNEGAKVCVSWLRPTIIPEAVSVLLLDADAHFEINKMLFGARMESSEIHAKRSGHVTQIYSTSMSKSRITLNSDDEQDKLRKVVNQATIDGKKVLVVCNKPVKEEMTGVKNTKKATEWEGATITHFGAIRGRDEWKNYDAVIIIGRNQPHGSAINDIARGIWCDDDKPLVLPANGNLSLEYRGYRLLSGKEKGVRVWMHPDPRGQKILELIRERESGQAIDRLRLVHPTKPQEVHIICNVPLDITVDTLRSFPEMVGGGTKLEKAWHKMEGVLPLSTKWLTTHHHDLFPNEDSAKYELKKTKQNQAGQRGDFPYYSSAIA